MAGAKVVDLNPERRMTQEALERIRASLNNLTVDNLDGFILLYTTKDEGGVDFEAFGIDWALLGISQAYIADLQAQLLNETHDDEPEIN